MSLFKNNVILNHASFYYTHTTLCKFAFHDTYLHVIGASTTLWYCIIVVHMHPSLSVLFSNGHI